MAETNSGLRATLRSPGVYRFFQQLVRTPRFYTVFFQDHVGAVDGDRIFDIGCGPGDIIEYLPQVEYIGIDVSPACIESAKAKFGDRGTFVCATANSSEPPQRAHYNIALAIGVLHHPDDDEAFQLLRLAAKALKPEGRLVTLDGAFVQTQSSLVCWLLSKDRGQNIRTPDAYQKLAAQVFGDVRVSVYDDLMRIPYTVALMECSQPLLR